MSLLAEMVAFLKAQNLNLTKTSRDGRINSAFNEDEILDLLARRFPVKRPNVRDWMDFSFEENGSFYPVNIKVSALQTADNLNCKLGIYYALTGQIPAFQNGVSWEKYFRTLRDNLAPNNADYYFLIINKDDPSDVFSTSLKGLESIVPNGNNLPFQAKWDDNRVVKIRDFRAAKDFLLQAFGESLRLRAEAYLYFQRHFGES